MLINARTNAATIDELKQKIEERNLIIKQLDAEISQYQTQIGETSKKAQTLQNTLNTLNASIKKLGAELSKTENNLVKTTYTITALDTEIDQKEENIDTRKEALKTLIKRRSQEEDMSMIQSMLMYKTLSEAWNYLSESWMIQDSINDNLEDIRDTKDKLETDKISRETQKKQLETYKSTLNDQKKLVEISQKDQNNLLKATKNTEATYKKELAARQAKKEAFEKELRQFESDLSIAIDPSKIPTFGGGLLSWPLEKRTITQTFGDTEFSRTHAQAYSGKGHNGIDIASPVGSPIMSAAEGTVIGAGDTDTACPGASYGKWVLIQHPNGLSTLYAHLSLIKVSQGQTVARGELLGYIGMTGYTTGPHLHFTVYASEGVKVLSRKSIACGSTYTMPIADLKAYLNPLLYL